MADVSLTHAANAYANNARLSGASGDSADDSGTATGGASFSGMLGQALGSSAANQYQAEALQMQSLTGGKVNLTDLITSVAEAQLTLQTVVGIRDRVISAYQSILSMPI